MKGLKLALIFAVIVLAFSGCGKEPDKEPNSLGTTQTENNAQNDKKVIKSDNVSEKIAGYAEVVSYVGDCDGDGTDEAVVLSTAAERDSKGEFLWNDGQNWALYIKDGAESYILYDEYVQAGSVYFDVADYYMSDGAKPVITVTVSTGAGLVIKNFAYSKMDNGYVETSIYNTQSIAEGGINRRFTSVPEILK